MGKKSGGRVRVKQMGPKMPNMMMGGMDGLAIPPEDMIQLPPKPNKNAAIVWPLAETFRVKYEGVFPVIYPNYLDSTKTTKQGRRIGVKDCVDVPTVADISGALQAMNIRHVIQPNKCYPSDAESHWDNKGRVLVDLPKVDNDNVDNDNDNDNDDVVMEIGADGAFDASSDIPEMGTTTAAAAAAAIKSSSSATTKKKLLKEIAVRIPHLKARKDRLEREAKQKAEEEAKAKAEAAAAAHKSVSSKASTSSSNKKKKGKKKR